MEMQQVNTVDIGNRKVKRVIQMSWPRLGDEPARDDKLKMLASMRLSSFKVASSKKFSEKAVLCRRAWGF